MLGYLRGAGIRARRSQISAMAVSSRQYLELLDLDLGELAKDERHATRGLVMATDFWLASKESQDDWLSGLFDLGDQDVTESFLQAEDFEHGATGSYPPDPLPPSLPASGFNLTPRLLQSPRCARS